MNKLHIRYAWPSAMMLRAAAKVAEYKRVGSGNEDGGQFASDDIADGYYPAEIKTAIMANKSANAARTRMAKTKRLLKKDPDNKELQDRFKKDERNYWMEKSEAKHKREFAKKFGFSISREGKVVSTPDDWEANEPELRSNVRYSRTVMTTEKNKYVAKKKKLLRDIKKGEKLQKDFDDIMAERAELNGIRKKYDDEVWSITDKLLALGKEREAYGNRFYDKNADEGIVRLRKDIEDLSSRQDAAIAKRNEADKASDEFTNKLTDARIKIEKHFGTTEEIIEGKNGGKSFTYTKVNHNRFKELSKKLDSDYDRETRQAVRIRMEELKANAGAARAELMGSPIGVKYEEGIRQLLENKNGRVANPHDNFDVLILIKRKNSLKPFEVTNKTKVSYEFTDKGKDNFLQSIKDNKNRIIDDPEDYVDANVEALQYSIKDSMNEFGNIVSNPLLEVNKTDVMLTYGYGVDSMFDMKPTSGYDRSFAALGDVYLSPGAPKSTIYHEFGHILEDTDPAIGTLANDYLNSRTSGEGVIKLSEITGNSGYDDTEVTKPDKFIDPYMGKQYSVRSESTEIISMGIEQIYQNPYELAMADPDYFDFIYGVTHLYDF